MKYLIVVMVILLAGCGLTDKEVVYETETITENEIEYVDRIVRSPLPINRPYINDGTFIEFTNQPTEPYIYKIYYGIPEHMPDCVQVNYPEAYEGSEITVSLACGNRSIIAPTVAPLAFIVRIWGSSNTVVSYDCTYDALDPNNQDHYIRLYVDGILKESYWLSDFEL